jgi:hypothetical protein
MAALVETEADVAGHAGNLVYVQGVYEQEDVRMMRVNPETLFLGHAVIVLRDGCRVFLYPPGSPEARRPAEEIREFEDTTVRALGVILPVIPQEGAIQNAPCLIDIRSIERA